MIRYSAIICRKSDLSLACKLHKNILKAILEVTKKYIKVDTGI